MKNIIQGTTPENENAVTPEQNTASSNCLPIESNQVNFNTVTPIKRKPKPPQKIRITLGLFIELPQGMYHKEAEKLYGESALNSSVSILKNKYGIVFKKVPNPIKNRAGTVSHFTRYIIEPEHRLAAKKLHNHFSALWGLEAVYDVEVIEHE